MCQQEARMSGAHRDGLHIVRQHLEVYGIEVVTTVEGRVLLVQLHAPRIAFQIEALDAEPSHRVHVSPNHTPWAYVYVTEDRRRGVAQYSATRYLKTHAPEIYFFVLLAERRLWMLLKSDLVRLEHEVRNHPRGQRPLAEAEHGVGLAPAPGALRLWFRREEERSYHLKYRIAPSEEPTAERK